MNPVKVLTWNLNWTGPHQDRAPIAERHISKRDPAVACFTEILTSTLPPGGFSLLADADHGYDRTPDHRKVALWSRSAWTQVDTLGSRELPSGRFVSGIALGVRFIGVCIPWSGAHVSTGKKNKTKWQDHRTFLQELHPVVIRYLHAPEPVCLLGDFNQRIPKASQPDEVFAALQAIFDLGLRPLTAGLCDYEGKALIDHITVGPGLNGNFGDMIPQKENGITLSDHTGVAGELQVMKTASLP